MKLHSIILISVLISASSVATIAAAQNAPGVPDGILSSEFQINQHPDMPFAASAPSAKYQHRTTAARRRADNGDPNGCNLQCPPDSN